MVHKLYHINLGSKGKINNFNSAHEREWKMNLIVHSAMFGFITSMKWLSDNYHLPYIHDVNGKKLCNIWTTYTFWK